MEKYVPIGVPASVMAILRYRKGKTGIPITKQLETLVLETQKPGELNAATKPVENGGSDENQA